MEARIAQAAKVKPLAELGLSPQCGFASVATGNPLTPDEQRAKLDLVTRVARRTWACQWPTRVARSEQRFQPGRRPLECLHVAHVCTGAEVPRLDRPLLAALSIVVA